MRTENERVCGWDENNFFCREWDLQNEKEVGSVMEQPSKV